MAHRSMTSRPSLDSTPPSEPFRQWEDDILNEHENVDVVLDIAYRAGFNAGADQELEACCDYMRSNTSSEVHCVIDAIRAARRPEPPNLKTQALDAWIRLRNEAWCEEVDGDLDCVLRALESLPD